MVYGNRTFCPFDKTCRHAGDCSRPLVKGVIEAAARTGLELSVYSERPGCYSPLPDRSSSQ